MNTIVIENNKLKQEVFLEDGIYTEYLIFEKLNDKYTLVIVITYGSEKPTDKQIEDAHSKYLEEYRHSMETVIKNYDCSTEVCSFFLNNERLWIPRELRACMMNAVNSYKLLGNKQITLSIKGKSYTFSIEFAEHFLSKLEEYALQVNNVTQQHLNNIQTIYNFRDLNHYGYTKNYPKILEFEYPNNN